jgi:iron complex transport system permease protein
MDAGITSAAKTGRTGTLAVLALALAVSALVSLAMGWVRISFTDMISALFFTDTSAPRETVAIIREVRLPRVLLDMAVGASLAVSGCAMQAVFRNPMASPFVTGISSGGAFGAALVIMLGLPAALTAPMAFAFALATAFFVYFLARSDRGVPVETLLLAGIAVSFFFSAMVAFMQYLADEKQLREIILWTMGRRWEADWPRVALVLPISVAGSLLLWFFRSELNLMIIGERAALAAGVDTARVRALILVLVALITGSAVSVSGVIGFVGLIVPHVMRMALGPDHRYLVPASAMGGALFLLLADTLARLVMAPVELPVGIITSLGGVPFFLYLLRNKRGISGFSHGY